MNEITIFLAQIMGPTLGLLGLGMILNPKFYGKVFKTIGSEDFDMFLTPMIMIAAGVVLVMKHFLWGSFTEILVSIIGLGALVKGGLLAVAPKAYKTYVNFVFKKSSGVVITFAGILWIAGGAWLSWVGFLA